MKKNLLIIFFALFLAFFLTIFEVLSIFYIAGAPNNPLINFSILLPLTSAIYIVDLIKLPSEYLLAPIFLTSTLAAFAIVLLISYLLKLVKKT